MKKLKLIGKGAFTKCFLNECGERVTLETVDPIKEVMAHGWFPESSLFPLIEETGLSGVYEMEYYPRVSSLKNNLDADQYGIYLTLRGLGSVFSENKFDLHSLWYKKFESIECEELRDTMLEALDACSNFGSDISFEISPRNVAVKNGKLVLLDCFYQVSVLNKVRGTRL